MSEAGEWAAALSAYEHAVGVLVDPGPAYIEAARLQRSRNDLLAAVDSFELALNWLPQDGLGWLDLGEVLFALDRVSDAVLALERAKELLDTDNAAGSPTGMDQAVHAKDLRLLVALGNAYMRSSRLSDAHAARTRLVERAPDSSMAWLGLGHVELTLDNDRAAESAYARALSLDAHPSVELLLHHGVASQYLARWDVARDRFAQALRMQPGSAIARWYLCQVELALGHWRAGWDLYGARFTTGAMRHRATPFPPWRGEPDSALTLLIMGDEGIGDEIMYAGCFDSAMQRVGQCIVECEPRLERLFRRSFPSAIVVGTNRTADLGWLRGLPQPTAQISSGDLPCLFRGDHAAFEPRRAFLRADPVAIANWKARLERELGPGINVGVSWRGGTAHTRTRARSIELETFASMLDVDGCNFVSLQYGGDELSDVESLARLSGRRVASFPEIHADYDATASLVAALDVVVSVCTAVIHLAGALGRPVHVLAPTAPGWRYGAYAPGMPWYPQVKVHRRGLDSPWDEICHTVRAQLGEMTRNVAA